MGKVIQVLLFFLWSGIIFSAGYFIGGQNTFKILNQELEKQLAGITSQTKVAESPGPTPVSTPLPNTAKKGTDYSGPQLWEAVNKARVEQGVQPLKQRDILCTLAQ